MNTTRQAETMSAAEYRARRELTRLSGDHLAQLLNVDPRTARRWEQGQYPVPEGVAEELREIAEETLEAVAEVVADAGEGPLLTYPDDEQFHLAHPDSRFTAAWHRAVTARAADETGNAIAYAPELTEVFAHTGGRSFGSYPLLYEVMAATGWERREAHDEIHALLEGLGMDENVVVAERRSSKTRAEYNPRGDDNPYIYSIKRETADEILALIREGSDTAD